jgi:hypothetical protein
MEGEGIHVADHDIAGGEGRSVGPLRNDRPVKDPENDVICLT